jgi:hypothetical protein
MVDLRKVLMDDGQTPYVDWLEYMRDIDARREDDARRAGKDVKGHFITLGDGDDRRVIFIEGPAQGAGGTQATEVARPTGREVQVAELCQGMTAEKVAEVNEWLRDVPDSHLEGVRSISAVAPGEKLYVDVRGGAGYVKRDNLVGFPDSSTTGLILTDENGNLRTRDEESASTLGMYLWSNDVEGVGHIVLSAQWGLNKRVLLHELGHHATVHNSQVRNAAANVHFDMVRAFRVNNIGDIPERVKKILMDTGLRPYSLVNYRELLADSYMVMMLGTDSQKFHLNALWDSFGLKGATLHDLLKLTPSDGKALRGRRKEDAHWVTIDDQAVLIGGPRQGSGGMQTVGGWRPDQPWKARPGTALPRPDTDMRQAQDWLLAEKPDDVARWNWAPQVTESVVGELSSRTGIPEDEVNQFLAQWYSYSPNDYRWMSIQEDAAEVFGTELSKWQRQRISVVIDERNREIQRIVDFVAANPDHEMAEALSTRQGIITYMQGVKDYQRMFPRFERETQRALIRAMYDHTQETLQEAGIGPTIRLQRGLKLDRSLVESWAEEAGASLTGPRSGRLSNGRHAIEYLGNTLESWTADSATANRFTSTRGESRMGVVLEMDIPIERIISTPLTGFGFLDEYEFVHLGSLGDETARIVGAW